MSALEKVKGECQMLRYHSILDYSIEALAPKLQVRGGAFGEEKSTFESQQERLQNRVEKGEARFVFLDPDGTFPPWIGVVIEMQSGVVYAAQCSGTP
jgi:hypothetical protein